MKFQKISADHKAYVRLHGKKLLGGQKHPHSVK